MTAYFRVSDQDMLKTCGDAPALEVSKARLEDVWSNLSKQKVFLPLAWGWKEMGFKVPPNPGHAMIL